MMKIQFDMPFASTVLGELEQAQGRHVRWIRAMGLLDSPDGIAQLMQWEPVHCGIYFHPKAVGDDRDLASDFYGWMILLDGQFDGPTGQSEELAEPLVQRLVAVVEKGLHPGGLMLPGERALADIWQRLRSGMSPAWRARATSDLRDFLMAYSTEAIHRESGHHPSVEAYMRLRFDSGGPGIILDISERVHRFEVPARAWSHPLVQRMREITAHVTNMVQDVLSLAKEEHDGEWNNIVILMRHHSPSLTRCEAVDKVQAMVREWTRQFLALEAEVPATCDAQGLTDDQRAAVYRYVDAMRSCMRGNYDWCRTTPRYDPARMVGSAAVGLLGTMLQPAAVEVCGGVATG